MFVEPNDDERMFVILLLEMAMRIRERRILDVLQVSAEEQSIHSKRFRNGGNLQIPTSSVARALLAEGITANRCAINACSCRR
jgi:hypothetical protein